MKTILLTLTYLVGAGELILAIYFWATNSKNEIRRVMALLAFSTGMWVITSGLTSYVSENTFSVFCMRIVFVSGMLLITALLHLTLVYPTQIQRLDNFHGWLLYLPAIIFGIISLTSNTIVTGFTGSATDTGRIIPGPLYNLYNIVIFGTYILACALLFIRRQKADGIHKKNLNLIFWSVVIGGIPAVIIDLIIPIVSRGVYPNANYGAMSTVIWLGVMTFIVKRK